LIVATAFTRAAPAAMAAEPDAAALLLPDVLLLGASDRADATQPMAILFPFPRPRRGRPSWIGSDGNGRRLNEEGEEARTRTRGLCAAAW
jgi:hypothetical protein